MKLCYNVTGQERKALVGAISHELNAPTKYLAAPTFAYEVGGYHIAKTGTVTGKDNLDLEDALHRQGFDAAEREYDEPDTYESGLGGMGALESPEELGFVPASELDELVIEVPLTGFTPEKLDNLAKLVTAKAPLLMAALGVEYLPIQQTDDTLRFPWFQGNLDGDTVHAYTTLVARSARRQWKSIALPPRSASSTTPSTPCGAGSSHSASLGTSISSCAKHC